MTPLRPTVCWPSVWIDAAFTAGLAVETETGFRVIGGDEMREKLQVFAEEITAAYEDEK